MIATEMQEDQGAAEFRDRMRRLFDSQYRAGYNAARLEKQSEAYKTGFLAGEAVGVRTLERARDRALGVGVLIGTGIGVVLTVAVVGWLS